MAGWCKWLKYILKCYNDNRYMCFYKKPILEAADMEQFFTTYSYEKTFSLERFVCLLAYRFLWHRWLLWVRMKSSSPNLLNCGFFSKEDDFLCSCRLLSDGADQGKKSYTWLILLCHGKVLKTKGLSKQCWCQLKGKSVKREDDIDPQRIKKRLPPRSLRRQDSTSWMFPVWP